MIWKQIHDIRKKVENFGKENPVLIAVLALVLPLALSAISQTFQSLLFRLFEFIIHNWPITLVTLWLTVLTIAISRIRTKLMNLESIEQPKTDQVVNDKLGSEILSAFDLVDLMVLILCCEQAHPYRLPELKSKIDIGLRDTKRKITSGALLNSAIKVKKYGLVGLSMDKTVAFANDLGESPRVSWRLLTLREWSHEQTKVKPIFP